MSKWSLCFVCKRIEAKHFVISLIMSYSSPYNISSSLLVPRCRKAGFQSKLTLSRTTTKITLCTLVVPKTDVVMFMLMYFVLLRIHVSWKNFLFHEVLNDNIISQTYKTKLGISRSACMIYVLNLVDLISYGHRILLKVLSLSESLVRL
jgi:hypothetical protein